MNEVIVSIWQPFVLPSVDYWCVNPNKLAQTDFPCERTRIGLSHRKIVVFLEKILVHLFMFYGDLINFQGFPYIRVTMTQIIVYR
jgi:hypothetical protein